MNYYLTGTRTGLSAEEAKRLAAANLPAVARPQDRADWMVVFLSENPRQSGQRPFILSLAEERIFEPLKWSRDYEVYLSYGKVKFATLGMVDSGNRYPFAEQTTLGL